MIQATTDLFGLVHKNFVIDGMMAKWIIPQEAAAAKVILFARINEVLVDNPKASDTYITFAVLNTGVPAMVVDYNYTLKESFSGALENVLTAYRWLLETGYTEEDIVVACDSPGGCLTVALLAMLNEEGKKLPCGGLKLYPEENENEIGNQAAGYQDSGFQFMEMNYLRRNR